MKMNRMWVAVGVIGLLAVFGAASRAAADPAGDLYFKAYDILQDEEYRRAADAFRKVYEQYPNSDFAADALYWAANSFFRLGDSASLDSARTALRLRMERFPKTASGDAEALAIRIDGALARQGDADAGRRVAEQARELAGSAARGHGSAVSGEGGGGGDDIRMYALNALLQMDSDRAVPILREVLMKRDPQSANLREKAVFILSQHETDESGDILLDVVHNDPDPEVRKQAVFWLGQVSGDKAVDAIEDILKSSSDPDLMDKAVFALSQHEGERAGELLRQIAMDPATSEHVREQAIFWLGQRESGDAIPFLTQLYEKVSSDAIREKIIFAMSQQGGSEAQAWLLGLVRSEGQPVEMRKKALFWLGQNADFATGDLKKIYDSLHDGEMLDQFIFVLSQRDDEESVSLLIDIARHGSPEARKKAVFWLGQSEDPRAAQLLEELIRQ